MDLWRYLAATDKHIVLYGMGNGADKIFAVLDRYGVRVEAVFASDGFVREKLFHGLPVESFSAVRDRFGADRMIVLVSFATALPEVMANVARIAEVCELYIPDVPVRGTTVFCDGYEEENRPAIRQAYDLLADERSREVFRGVLNFRRTGRLDTLRATEDARDGVMRSLLHLGEYRLAADVGAYDGDTARELFSLCPRMQKIVALEPDRRNFRKLSAYAAEQDRLEILPFAAWDENTTLIFDDSGNRNAGVDADHTARRTVEVAARRLDDLLADRAQPVDYIKYDVEGSEKQALLGSAEIIGQDKPDLLVSLYHRTEDLHELILLLHRLCPEYRLYVRRYPYIPAWDLNLFATVRPLDG